MEITCFSNKIFQINQQMSNFRYLLSKSIISNNSLNLGL